MGHILIATVAIPTLLADGSLDECLGGLRAQTRKDFEIIVIDNSGRGLAGRFASDGVRVLTMPRNVGYGAAVNRAFDESSTEFLLTLNDDAVPCPAWMASLIGAAETDAGVGMCASQVRLDSTTLDSAGMLIYGDGSSKQRGYGEPAARYPDQEEVLLPSASAALYRRRMLKEIGLFDEYFFLYCEDTDLGLRARRAGWRCLYVPAAQVEHGYSHSSGPVSALKAYYVERNRILVAMKNFSYGMLVKMPLYGTARYLAHLKAAFSGRGKSAEFRREGGGVMGMAAIALRAHIAFLAAWFKIWRDRDEIQKTARLSWPEFTRLLEVHSTTPKALAEH